MEPQISVVTGSGGAGSGGVLGAGGDGGDVILNISNRVESSAVLLLLSLPRVPYASYDSGRKDLPSSCLEGTRVGILNDITAWLERTEPNTPPVYWLNGLAGIGKSTIAKTVSDRAEKKGILGASFFFSRSDNLLRDPQLVFPTLAFQLAHSDNAFKDVIVEAIQQDADLGHKALLTQIQRLIVTPLLKIDPNRKTSLIVLDALDECEEKGGAELLKLLFSHAIQIPFLRILITSRPEPHISSVFHDAPNYAQTILHDIEASVIEQDIRLYITSELAKIPHKLGLRMAAGWISEDEVDSLVAKSGKLFVYAATTIRFIGDDRLRDPRRHLNLILNSQAAQQIGATPHTQLDNLYVGVLRNALSESNRRDVLDRFQLVVGSIVLLRQPLPLHSLAHFIGFQIDTVDATLYHLRSVIIPPSNIHDAPRIYHPSFLDFITDSRRCAEPDFVIFAIPDQERRHAIRCFELMATFLKRDMAGISHPWVLNSNVDEFERKVNDAIPPEVQYACRFWASHLSCVEFGNQRAVGALEGFLRRSILWWLEAMSLIGSSFSAADCIQAARHWAVRSNCKTTLLTMLSDTYRFILAHSQVIRESALQVYYSALAFTPHDTAFYKAYCNEDANSIRVLQGLESQWPRGLGVFLGHDGAVYSIAFSPDGSRLASASHDHSIRLWNATSGDLIASLKGHFDSVTSVAFSPDGLWLASGSHDTSVRLWDAISGRLISSLEGHSSLVLSIAFSPNGLWLASGSHDCSIRLWDAMSGKSIALLEGHFCQVSSVVFSPDGLQLASGSDDCSIQLWDIASGRATASLQCYSDQIRAVAFSPSGLQLASGFDHSLWLWDATSGKRIALNSHPAGVLCIAFSPDGLLFASGSYGGSIQLWDAISGKPTASLRGHSESIYSVAFAPDGLQLVSGSGDWSIRLWDITGNPIIWTQAVTSSLVDPDLALGTHDHAQFFSDSVTSIAISLDGSQLALGSKDTVIQLWNVTSGQQIASLYGHDDWVMALAFSPDGLQLASASHDSVWLWDTRSLAGRCTTSLEGHSSCLVAFSPDGFQLASGSDEQTIKLWDTKSGKHLKSLEIHSMWVECIVFSPDGLWLVSGSPDQSIHLWDASSGKAIRTLKGPAKPVKSVTFSPDSLQVAVTFTCANTIQLWDTLSGHLIASLEDPSGWPTSVEFSFGHTLVSQSHVTVVWDLSSPPFHIVPESYVMVPLSRTAPHSLIWSYHHQWIQVHYLPGNHVRHVCYIPPLYSPTTEVQVRTLGTHSRIAFGCSDGRVVILHIDHHSLFG